MTSAALDVTIYGGVVGLAPVGSWTAGYAATLERLIDGAPLEPPPTAVSVDLAGLGALDTFGAWLVERLLRVARTRTPNVSLTGVPARYRGLIDEMAGVNRARHESRPQPRGPLAALNELGFAVANSRVEAGYFLSMLGALGASFGRVLSHPKRFRLTSAVHQLDRVGWRAIPIIFLITFLIGGIIAQQGFFHFRRFGANDYVVDLVGILVVREIGVLIVAIMLAGRSGSAYTAELGSMKMREEIDALRTMGLDPVDILMLPRVAALICALPILTFLGDLSALFGGGLVAWLYGGMSPEIFLARLNEALSVTHFEVGMIKAPFMALVIGTVACAEGRRVEGSAESLGERTTISVVKSIFLVILLDGLFAIFFASIGM